MLIVAGHLIVDPDGRQAYLDDCVTIVEQARSAEGCLDFSITADLVDRSRINVYERWTTQEAVNAFRGSGPGEDQSAAIRSAQVSEYDISDERSLT